MYKLEIEKIKIHFCREITRSDVMTCHVYEYSCLRYSERAIIVSRIIITDDNTT